MFVGVLYFHRISDFRVGGTTRKNFKMFQEFCGKRALRNVVLVTNMWGEVSTQRGERNEAELMREGVLFKPALDMGAQMARHKDTAPSAKDILRLILNNHPLPLRIQEEMVDEGKDITETSAGRELNREMHEQIEKHKEEMRMLEEKAKKKLEEEKKKREEERKKREDEWKKRDEEEKKARDGEERRRREEKKKREEEDKKRREVEEMRRKAEKEKLEAERKRAQDEIERIRRESERMAPDYQQREQRLEECFVVMEREARDSFVKSSALFNVLAIAGAAAVATATAPLTTAGVVVSVAATTVAVVACAAFARICSWF